MPPETGPEDLKQNNLTADRLEIRIQQQRLSSTAHRFDTGTKRGTAGDGPLEGAVVLIKVGTIGGTVESASTVVLAEKTIPILPPTPATPSPLAPPAGKNFTTKLPRTTLGTGLARTGTNTG